MRGWGADGAGGDRTALSAAASCLLFLVTVGLTAALPPPASSGDKPMPDRWDGHITYDYTRQKMGGTYGGKITKGEHPLSKVSSEGQDKRKASCPPPTNRCQGPVCHSDEDCPKAGSGCCFNGCIKTCSFLVDPPAVVDWLEESPDLSPALSTALMSDKEDGGEGHLLESVTAPDVVTLDGCILTPKQKEHLDELRQSGSVGSWCVSGNSFLVLASQFVLNLIN